MQGLAKAVTEPRRGLLALFVAFLVGGSAYYALEILWRGHSHVTMWFCGAICLSGILLIECTYSRMPLYKRALFSALFITAVEFVFGCVFNLWLRLDVWDYSEVPFNLLGQICLPYSVMWYFLAFPAALVCRLILFAVGYHRVPRVSDP